MSNRRKPRQQRATLVAPRPAPDGTMSVVILDVVGSVDTEYCIHGQVSCYGDCGDWLWLGSETYAMVHDGNAVGLCVPCATKMIPSDRQQPTGHVDDHRRSDGPH